MFFHYFLAYVDIVLFTEKVPEVLEFAGRLASCNVYGLFEDHNAEGSMHFTGGGFDALIFLETWTDFGCKFVNELIVCLEVHLIFSFGFVLGFVISSSFGAWAGNGFTFEKSVEVCLQILSVGWMSFEYDLTCSVKKHNVRNTVHGVDLAAVRGSSVVVNGPLPVLFLNVRGDDIGCFVNADTDDLDIVTPIGSSLFEHIFIVLHWGLAWWAPGGPEIDEPNFTLLVLQGNRIASINWNDILDWIVHAACTNYTGNINLNVVNSIGKWLNFILECLNLVFHFWREGVLQDEELVILDFGVAQWADGLSDDFNIQLVLEAVLLDSIRELGHETVSLLLGHVGKRWHFSLI